MPLVSPIDIAVLSSPVPLPGESGTVSPGSFGVNTQQNFSAMTRGSGVTSPIGTGNQMTPMSTSTGRAQGQGDSAITGAALESGGANVGGVVQQAPKDELETKVEFATYEDQQAAAADKAQEEQVDEFMAAYQGDSSEKKSIKESLESAGQEYLAQGGTAGGVFSAVKAAKAFRDSRKGEQSGMSAARDAKRADRKADREARKKAGLKGSEKRAMRKAQRKQRRAAFKEFKEERDYQASLEAAQL